MKNDQRPDPDALLSAIKSESENLSSGKKTSGQLRIFLGMSPGVGKTFAMLKAAHIKKNEGLKVFVGVVETHGRKETLALLDGLLVIPLRKVSYKNVQIAEFDLDASLRIRPDIVLVDELAHTNVPGSRHPKRFQDILELLNAGIDVYTTLNVQHLESRKELVEQITGVVIRETVPDGLLDRANLVELVDIAPSELLKRLKEGNVYQGDRALVAAENFFTLDKLTALREIALRATAERVDQDLQRFSAIRSEQPWQSNERLLVAVSHSPFSERLIRATRRLAYNLEAPWIALHVDIGTLLGEADQIQLQRNLNLARELKAEILHTTDTDVASAVQRVARQKNVTQIIVGRPTRRWFRELIEGGSLLQRLVKETFDVDVHIIRNGSYTGQKPSLLDELSHYRSNTGWVKYYWIFWVFFAVTILGAIAEPYIGYRAVGFIFLLAVVLTSLWGSIGAVLVSASLSAVIWNYGFIPPRFTFIISSVDDSILLFSNFVVALITGILTNRTRIRENLIRAREMRTDLLNCIMSDISKSQTKGEFIQKVGDRISNYFEGRALVVVKDDVGDLQFDKVPLAFALSENEKAVAIWSFKNRSSAGWSTETLRQSAVLCIPIGGDSEVVGLVVYRPSRKNKLLSVEQLELLNSIATQLGTSIERQILNRRLNEAQRAKDSELLHQTLLNSISHEIRTPLTAIMGIASSLDKNLTTDKTTKELASSLFVSTDRLNRVIENLLDMSRLSAGGFGLSREWHDLSDIVGVALRKLENSLSEHKVNVEISDDLGLLYVDYRLFEHAISNLILNAIQHAGKISELTVSIVANRTNSNVVISISDNGKGIPPEYLKELFSKFYRVPGSAAGGTGLGLSIVKGIVELHKGRIYYEPNLPQGSRFVIELPFETPPQMEGQS